jgi:hypothetical protein
MKEHTYRSQKKFKPCAAGVASMLVILFLIPALGWGRSKTFAESHLFKNAQNYDSEMSMAGRDLLYPFEGIRDYTHFDGKRPHPFLAKNYRRGYNNLSPEEKTRLKRRMEEWESLPPERREILRHRMEKYKRLPLRERDLFQQRYRQLQKLPPDERYMIREKLQKWDGLSPDEKEQIRRRFRIP